MNKVLWHQHLYLRIWLAVVVAIVVLTGVLGWFWREQAEHERAQRPGRELVVLDATSGDEVARVPARPIRGPGPGRGLEFQVELDAGQRFVVRLPLPPRPPGRADPLWHQQPWGLTGLLALVALGVALGAYPIVRRLTQRLENLQQGVERWGQGDLSARLPVQGRDEVAFLAERFNAAAQRVETLMGAHKSLLANASHELRSPLARIRMGLELLGGTDGAAQRQEIARNIGELDELIDEILLASRLDLQHLRGPGHLGPLEEVDVVGLAAEECARTGAVLDLPEGLPTGPLQGQSRLLRRLVRNLLENARRYGLKDNNPASVSLGLRASTDQGRQGLLLEVSDQGPGVPPDQRERVFEPFYRLPGASEREGGVGLGLALVRSIAQQHGGWVRCEANPAGGACFVVFLPQ
jgi:signal transduction histidine kinase